MKRVEDIVDVNVKLYQELLEELKKLEDERAQ